MSVMTRMYGLCLTAQIIGRSGTVIQPIHSKALIKFATTTHADTNADQAPGDQSNDDRYTCFCVSSCAAMSIMDFISMNTWQNNKIENRLD